MNNNPLLAIILPTYRNYKMIDEAVDSVLNQTDTSSHIELALIDDGSPDDGRVMNKLNDCSRRIKQIRDNIDVVVKRSYRNNGQSMARNLGISITTSPWICYLDVDDLCHRDRIKHTLRHIYDYAGEKTDLIFFNYRYQLGPKKDAHQDLISPKLVASEEDTPLKSAQKHHISDSIGIAHSRELFNRVGGWPPFLLSGEDTVFCRRLIQASEKTEFSEEIIGLKRQLFAGQAKTDRRFDSGLYIKLDRTHHLGATGQYIDDRELKDLFIDKSQDPEYDKRYHITNVISMAKPYDNPDQSDIDTEDLSE